MYWRSYWQYCLFFIKNGYNSEGDYVNDEDSDDHYHNNNNDENDGHNHIITIIIYVKLLCKCDFFGFYVYFNEIGHDDNDNNEGGDNDYNDDFLPILIDYPNFGNNLDLFPVMEIRENPLNSINENKDIYSYKHVCDEDDGNVDDSV